jgi:integrase
MGKRPGLKYAVVKRLDSLMADGEKRSEAKAAARAEGRSTFAFTTSKIHAFETRNNYQKIIMRFVDWCRDEHSVRDLDRLDNRADELASLYLCERIARGYSAWTLQTERSALRMFFRSRDLAGEVALPRRKREHITRSRLPAMRDTHFQPENWPSLVSFVQACGLRREELRDLFVRDIYYQSGGQLVVHVCKGKGGKDRKVPVFPGREQSVLAVKEGRSGDEKAFARLPSAMDIHAYRRRFAQELYEYHAQRPLPPREGRLQSADFDRVAAEKVTKALGHGRLDIVFGHYVR